MWWWWHFSHPFPPATMAHVIRSSFKQVYLAPGQRGNFLYEGSEGGKREWSEVGVNEAPTEVYHLERFWHAEVAVAACASALAMAVVHLWGRDSREGSVGVSGAKGQASESCKSQKGTGLEVSQSWRLEEPSTRGERIGGGTEKSPRTPLLREQTLLFSKKKKKIHTDDLRGFYFGIMARSFSREHSIHSRVTLGCFDCCSCAFFDDQHTEVVEMFPRSLWHSDVRLTVLILHFPSSCVRTRCCVGLARPPFVFISPSWFS